ncbi:50S ribosomal protein L11 methyltransferase [Sneathiella aquimaris]|uniref:50S ribosomal protein L11 methyltransferase n=1 Tax=Sneathiella aquimaris TaxID=2599305 RepID=UPI00146A5A7E|nr:50S ribosomal protein L11 methyltransferase [Sneathiella aquimaris]
MSNQPDPTLWQLSINLPLPESDAIEQIFEEHFLTTSLAEIVSDGSLWRLDILFDHQPDQTLLDQVPDEYVFEIAPLIQRDWVSESQKQLPPVSAGRFYIHGSHDPKHTSSSVHDLTIDAGRAFGTGLHETTFGCLLALDDIHKERTIFNALDLGCGSGVLALAIAKAWGRPVLASDIDPDAVITTKENARLNCLSPLVRVEEATGLNNRLLAKSAPYDLITANILAWPLVALAPKITAALSTGGVLVLSGLLGKQENMVRNAYRLQGLHLHKRYKIGDWHSLILKT